jgi:RNA polymerase sporulation-specific sigma factor
MRKNDTTALTILLERYKNYIKYQSKKYFMPGSDYEDLLQEGFIGLFKACRDYNENIKVPFKNFAIMCIKRQIITAIKTATRQKHIPLNSAISLFKPILDSQSKTIIDIIAVNGTYNPEQYCIAKEDLKEVELKLNLNLSKLEYDSLMLYMDGMTYAQIASFLGISFKSVTNAMYRLQKKLKKLKQNFRE